MEAVCPFQSEEDRTFFNDERPRSPDRSIRNENRQFRSIDRNPFRRRRPRDSQERNEVFLNRSIAETNGRSNHLNSPETEIADEALRPTIGNHSIKGRRGRGSLLRTAGGAALSSEVSFDRPLKFQIRTIISAEIVQEDWGNSPLQVMVPPRKLGNNNTFTWLGSASVYRGALMAQAKWTFGGKVSGYTTFELMGLSKSSSQKAGDPESQKVRKPPVSILSPSTWLFGSQGHHKFQNALLLRSLELHVHLVGQPLWGGWLHRDSHPKVR
jgi:hypothetical protein